MIQKIIKTIKGSESKDILIDVAVNEGFLEGNVIVFSHGFKGFKDWGTFNLVSEYFASKGFIFLKFNFSHNGTTNQHPEDFVDLEAFGNNNFSKELDDLGFVLDWIESQDYFVAKKIILLGHSRGGGISMLKSSEDNRIDKLVTWASPSNFLNRMSKEKLNVWKEKGVVFVYNGRTKQNMPLYHQFLLDSIKNKKRLDIESAVKNLKIPQLIIHGDSDTTVSLQEAKNIHSCNIDSILEIIKGGDHVFGGVHPFESKELPKHLKEVVDITLNFVI